MESMTGFGKSLVEDETKQVSCEIKSVNQRFLDLQFKMPRELNQLELTLRKLAQSQIKRGKVEVSFQIVDHSEGTKTIELNQSLLKSLIQQIKEVEATTKKDLTPILGNVLNHEDFFTIEKKASADLEPLVKEAFEKALYHLKETRQQEGQRLLETLQQQKALFTMYVTDLSKLNGEIEASHYQRLKTRLTAILEDKISEDRLLTEVALVVEKGDIHEELTRLFAHLDALSDLLELKTPVGRQLDFLVQEMNREVNTIGSKSQDLKIKEQVVGMKTVLEQFREQIQNIE